MLEAAAAALAQRRVQRLLAGVAEGRVAEVVAEPDRLGQVLVEAERAGDGAGDPAGLQRVGEPGAVVVALGRDEDLGLVLEPPEGLASGRCGRDRAETACGPGCRAPRPRAAPDRSGSPPQSRNSSSQARTRSSKRGGCASVDLRVGSLGPPRWLDEPPRHLRPPRGAARARDARASRRTARSTWRSASSSAAGASASGLPIASTMKRCASSESGKAARFAADADDAAGGAGEAAQVLGLAAVRAGGELGREAGRQRQLEPEGERRLQARRPLRRRGRRAAPGSGRAGCRRAGWARPSRAGAAPRRRRARPRSAPGRRRAGAGSRRAVETLVTVSSSPRPSCRIRSRRKKGSRRPPKRDFGLPRPLGDRADPAPRLRVEVEDAVGLAVADAAQHHRLCLQRRSGHSRIYGERRAGRRLPRLGGASRT